MSDTNQVSNTGNVQPVNQIEEAIGLLNNALNSLKGASSQTQGGLEEANKPTSPILNAVQSSSAGAEEAMKAAEDGVKTAIANAEKHMHEAIQAFPTPQPPVSGQQAPEAS